MIIIIIIILKGVVLSKSPFFISRRGYYEPTRLSKETKVCGNFVFCNRVAPRMNALASPNGT